MRPLFLSLLTSVLFSTGLSAREFTSTDGRKLNGEIVSVKGENVVLKVHTSTYTIPKSRFIAEDIKYIETWAEEQAKNIVPNMEVLVSSGKSNRSDRDDSYDDRRGHFQFSITIENQENGHKIEDAKLKLVVFGEECGRRDTYMIMQNTSFDFTLDFGDSTRLEADKVSYRFDDHAPALWGHKYEGYALEITNASGKTIYTKATPAKFQDKIEELIGLKRFTSFDGKVERTSTGSSYYIDR